MILVEKAQYNSCCFCCKKKKITMQWSHVKTFEFERVQLLLFCFAKRTKNYNAMVSRQNIRIRLLLSLLFDVNFFVLFCFCETNFDVFTIFSELSGLKRNVLFMEIYTSIKSSIFSLTKYAIFM